MFMTDYAILIIDNNAELYFAFRDAAENIYTDDGMYETRDLEYLTREEVALGHIADCFGEMLADIEAEASDCLDSVKCPLPRALIAKAFSSVDELELARHFLDKITEG